MLAEEPDVRKALVRFREGLGGNLRGAPSLLDYRLGLAKLASPYDAYDPFQLFYRILGTKFLGVFVSLRLAQLNRLLRFQRALGFEAQHDGSASFFGRNGQRRALAYRACQSVNLLAQLKELARRLRHFQFSQASLIGNFERITGMLRAVEFRVPLGPHHGL